MKHCSRRCLLLSTLLVLTSCSARQRATRAIKGARALQQAGDELLVSGKADAALKKYDRGRKALDAREDLFEEVHQQIQDAARATQQDIELRLGAFEGPEGAVWAGLHLAGSGEEDDLAEKFWDGGAMAIRALGEEQWTALSGEGQERLEGLCIDLVFSFFRSNRRVVAEAQLNFTEVDQQDDCASMDVVFAYGKNSMKGHVEAKKTGPMWRIVNVESDIFRVSELLSKSLATMASVRPLEEALARDDAYSLMMKAADVAFNEEVTSFDARGRVVVLAMETKLTMDDGVSLTLPRSRMVELLGETRSVDGETEVKVRVMGTDARTGTGVAGMTEGWINAESLPSTGEEDLWGEI